MTRITETSGQVVQERREQDSAEEAPRTERHAILVEGAQINDENKDAIFDEMVKGLFSE